MVTKPSKSKAFDLQLAGYSAAALAALAPAAAGAAIVKNAGTCTASGGGAAVCTLTTGFGLSTITLDVNGDGGAGDVFFRVPAGGGNNDMNAAGAGAGNSFVGTAPGFGLANVKEGFLVGAGVATSVGAANPYFFASSVGAFYNNSLVGNLVGGTNLVGFRFTIGGSTHFGFANITLDDVLDTLTVNSWQYESVAGQAIQAVTPAPASLALLASGAAGLAALRRRRRKNDKPELGTDAVPA